MELELDNKQTFGYDTSRFPSIDDQFECLICSNIVYNPMECSGCGQLFCKKCIEDWLKKNPRECPNRCQTSTNSIKELSKAMQRMYNNIDIKCSNYAKCNKIVKMADLEKHEYECTTPNCVNFEFCGSKVSRIPSLFSKNLCSLECELQIDIKNTKDNKQILELIKLFSKNVLALRAAQAGSVIQDASNNNSSSINNLPVQNGSGAIWKWDPRCAGTGIKISNDGYNCFLQESAYMFKTVIADTPMMNGCHYWEIIADSKTENELKIGVSTRKDFNFNTAFCDSDFGFGFYGLGQLRSGSNASGQQFGKRFKKEGTLGIYLNMNKGTLSFALNGENFGVAFTSDSLKKGPLYAAVSLLHLAGCGLKTGVPTPAYFLGQ